MASKVALASKLPPRTDQVPQLPGPAKKVLPSGVFANVLSFLETRTDGHSVARTCVAWAWLRPKCTLGCLNAREMERIELLTRKQLGRDDGPELNPSVRVERFVSTCRGRFEKVRAIDLRDYSLDWFANPAVSGVALLPALFRAYPNCVSFAYPVVSPWHTLPDQSVPKMRASVIADFTAAFGSLPGGLTALDMTAVHACAATVFSFVPENSQITSLALSTSAISPGKDENGFVKRIQSIGCKLLSLKRVDLRTNSRALPFRLFQELVNTLPQVETISIAPFVSEEDEDDAHMVCFVNVPKEESGASSIETEAVKVPQSCLKRVEFTNCRINSRMIQLLQKASHQRLQFVYEDCSFSGKYSMIAQLPFTKQ